jgi:hypothetical protein
MLRRVLFGAHAVRRADFSGFIGVPLLMKYAETLGQTNWLLLASNTLVDFFAMN